MLTPEMLPNEYIGMYAKATTRYQKQFAIRRFLQRFLGRSVPDLNAAMTDYLASRDAPEVVTDLMRYQTDPSYQTLAPKTKSLYSSLILTYFEDCCNLSLSGLQKKMMLKSNCEKIRAITVEANPTREMVRTILQHCTERHSAEILISISGGLRFGEILQLRHEDIDLTTLPATVHVRGATTKNGEPRRTYLSAEAVDALKAYYRVRDAMIAKSNREKRHKCHGASLDLSLIFPWSMTNEGKLISDAIVNAGYTERDRRTGRYKVHFHLWRKYFLTQAKRRANPAYVEAWAGHAGYLSSSYHRPSDEEDREEYRKCEADLTIIIPEDYLKIKVEQADEIGKLQTAFANQQHVINRLVDDLGKLRQQQESGIGTPFSGVLIRRVTQDEEYRGT